MKPLLLLDVDGPLNPFLMDRATAAAKGYRLYYIEVGGTVYPVLLNPQHGTALRELADLVELVWATTWQDDANALLSPLLGLPTDLRVIPLHADHPRDPWYRGCWKTAAVLDWVGRQPFAWLDDEVNRFDRDWLAARTPADVLLCNISPGVGLTDEDFAAVRSWAESI
jgi:hypothetical protein